MSKYDDLWAWIGQNGADSIVLTFDEIEKIVGFPVDHSFLTSKKELTNYGYQTVKISLKERFVLFKKSV